MKELLGNVLCFLSGCSNRFCSLIITGVLFACLLMLASFLSAPTFESALTLLGFGSSAFLGLMLLVSLPYFIELFLNLKQAGNKSFTS